MAIVEYGGVYIPTTKVRFLKQQQDAPARGSGTTDRSNRQGTRQYVISSLDGGLGIHDGNIEDHSTRIANSEGIWTHQIGELHLPPELLANTTLTAVDASNFKENNINPVWATSGLGNNGSPLTYYGVQRRLYRVNNSTGAVSLAHTFTNNIVWIGEVFANSTLYFAVITDGTTDDAKVTTDPTEGSITWNLWFALTSGDRVDFAISMPDLGGVGITYLSGKLGDFQGAFWLSQASPLATAPSIVVDVETREEEGNIAIANTGAVSPEFGWPMPGSGETSSLSILHNQQTIGGTDSGGNPGTATAEAQTEASNWTTWLTPNNVTDSDDSYASCSYEHTFDSDSDSFGSSVVIVEVHGGIAILTDILVGSGFDLSSIPNAARITGMIAEIECAENAIGDDIIWWRAQFVRGGDLIGENRADGTELGTTDAYKTFGTSVDRWGTELTGEQINDGQLGFAIQFRSEDVDNTAGSSGSVRVDHIRVTIYYRELGVHSFVPTGCKLVGRDPIDKNKIWYIRPTENAATSNQVARSLFYATVSYNPEQTRVVVTHNPINLTGLPYVQAACFGLTDMYIAAGSSPTIAETFLKLPLQTLVPQNLDWSREQGFTDPIAIANLTSLSDDVIITVTDSQTEDSYQDMLYFSGTNSFHFYGPAESVTGTLAFYGPSPVDPLSRYRHRFYPVGDTHLGVSRQYTPTSAHSDPNQLPVSVNRKGNLLVELPTLDIFGPEEANKMIIKATSFGRDLDSTHTAKLYYRIDGADVYTEWGEFEEYADSLALDPLLAFRSLSLAIELDPDDTGEYANPLPIVIEGVAMWPDQRTWVVDIDPTDSDFQSQYPEGIETMWDILVALPIVNTLKIGVTEVNATWDVLESSFEPTDQPLARAKPIVDRGAVSAIRFNEVVS